MLSTTDSAPAPAAAARDAATPAAVTVATLLGWASGCSWPTPRGTVPHMTLPITVRVGAGFVVAPLVRWLLSSIDSAPAPLRLLATLPAPLAVVVTTVLGLAAGLYLAREARKEALEVTVDAGHVGLVQDGQDRHLPESAVDAASLDGKELVLLDARTAELLRVQASDVSAQRLWAAFEGAGCPWQ